MSTLLGKTMHAAFLAHLPADELGALESYLQNRPPARHPAVRQLLKQRG